MKLCSSIFFPLFLHEALLVHILFPLFFSSPPWKKHSALPTFFTNNISLPPPSIHPSITIVSKLHPSAVSSFTSHHHRVNTPRRSCPSRIHIKNVVELFLNPTAWISERCCSLDRTRHRCRQVARHVRRVFDRLFFTSHRSDT
ncbi:hypothetical protein F4778DRAFT_511420 [Xylariomycetidae sp. FL2044]|nr:hypothetical protein F4778DRAFT_511420 [Xylariomycetidae sp. FL2044]